MSDWLDVAAEGIAALGLPADLTKTLFAVLDREDQPAAG